LSVGEEAWGINRALSFPIRIRVAGIYDKSYRVEILEYDERDRFQVADFQYQTIINKTKVWR